MNEKLRTIRLAHGWTQKETAERAKIGLTTYLRAEQETQHPHEDTIGRLCLLFKRSREELGFPPKGGKMVDATKNRSW